MKLSDNSIDRLQNSINRLVENNRRLDDDNQKLVKRNTSQQNELDDLRAKLSEAQDRLSIVTASNAMIEMSGGAQEARQRVNSLLRDINKCISLVNK